MRSVPRARGDEPSHGGRADEIPAVFPAHAGMNRQPVTQIDATQRVPRARGDEPYNAVEYADLN